MSVRELTPQAIVYFIVDSETNRLWSNKSGNNIFKSAKHAKLAWFHMIPWWQIHSGNTETYTFDSQNRYVLHRVKVDCFNGELISHCEKMSNV